MAKNELDFEWTVKDVDKAFLDAARGEGEGESKTVKSNLLEKLKAQAGLNKAKQ